MSGDRTQKEFLKLRRTSGESMDSYTARAQLYRSTLLAEDAGFEVGDHFFVGFLLDNAEITLRDRAMVMNAARHLNTIEAVIPALRRLGPLLQGSAPIGRSEHNRPALPWPGTQAPAVRPDSGSANSGRWAPRKSNSSYFPNSRKPFHAVNQVGPEVAPADPDSEDQGWLDEGAHDLENPDAPQPAETECPPELEDQEHMAMAAFYKAKARVLDVRKARGFFQKPEPTAQSSPERQARLKEMMKHAPCRACGQFGHWSRDKECPMQERPGFPAERREVCASRVMHAACRFDGRLRRFERPPHVGDGDIFPCFSRVPPALRRRLLPNPVLAPLRRATRLGWGTRTLERMPSASAFRKLTRQRPLMRRSRSPSASFWISDACEEWSGPRGRSRTLPSYADTVGTSKSRRHRCSISASEMASYAFRTFASRSKRRSRTTWRSSP